MVTSTSACHLSTNTNRAGSLLADKWSRGNCSVRWVTSSRYSTCFFIIARNHELYGPHVGLSTYVISIEYRAVVKWRHDFWCIWSFLVNTLYNKILCYVYIVLSNRNWAISPEFFQILSRNFQCVFSDLVLEGELRGFCQNQRLQWNLGPNTKPAPKLEFDNIYVRFQVEISRMIVYDVSKLIEKFLYLRPITPENSNQKYQSEGKLFFLKPQFLEPPSIYLFFSLVWIINYNWTNSERFLHYFQGAPL